MKSRFSVFAGAFLLALIVVSVPVVAQASPATVEADNPITSTLDVVDQWWSQILVTLGFSGDDNSGNQPQPPAGMAPNSDDSLSSQSLTDSNETEIRAGIDPTG